MTGRNRSEALGKVDRKRQALTCRADIVQDGVRPDLGIDGFDDGGHFDGDAAMVLPFVAVTVDGLASKSELPGGQRNLGSGTPHGPPPPRCVTWDETSRHADTQARKGLTALVCLDYLLWRSKCLLFAAPPSYAENEKLPQALARTQAAIRPSRSFHEPLNAAQPTQPFSVKSGYRSPA